MRIYNRALSPAEAGMLADLTPVTDIAALAGGPAQPRRRRTRFATTSSSTRRRRISRSALDAVDGRQGNDEMRSMKAFRPSW